ncbi:MAG TPA: hypothetical protein VF499_09445, partial [Afipia sp.]
MIRRGYGGGALSAAPPINENGADDPFETLFAPAKPALDAVIALWSAMSWLGTQRQSKLPLFDPAKVGKLIKLIPTGDRILEAQARFRDAAYEPAPEAWTHLAIGLMLQSMPAAADIHDSYRCGIVDSLYRDPVVTEGLDPGFSAPVIVR